MTNKGILDQYTSLAKLAQHNQIMIYIYIYIYKASLILKVYLISCLNRVLAYYTVSQTDLPSAGLPHPTNDSLTHTHTHTHTLL